MHFVIEPSALESGSVAVPGDKSISHRALMLGAVANGTTEIRGFLAGEDCLATLAAIRAMGVTVDEVSTTCASGSSSKARSIKGTSARLSPTDSA